MDDLFEWLFGAACVAGVAFLGYAIYDSATAETFSLRKDAWDCTRSHSETQTTWIMVNNQTIPVFSETMVCDQWSARRS